MNYLIVDDEKLIIKDIERTLREVINEDDLIFTADHYLDALEIIKREQIYIAFLDVDMPEVNGVTLANKISVLSPLTNIIFITGYAKYALDAWKTSASAFLLKPLTKSDLINAMTKLRNTYSTETKAPSDLFFRCFGNFEIFYQGQPLSFKRRQSKEFVAYLIDRCGAEVTEQELRTVLWEEELDSEAKKSYVRTLASDIRRTFESCHAENLFISRRSVYSLDITRMNCDYYDYKKGTPGVEFDGEYMTQYSWAESTVGFLNRVNNL